jgi:hypothetical protein
MAQYNNIKNFCNRVIHLEKSGSKEIRLTKSEAVILMSELNQLLLDKKSTVQAPAIQINSSSSFDAGTF